ncbi:MAG: phosphoribosylanthranilate isomerase [Anaerolineae bacterium]|nr:MAG: phosphoribosylanthranilate isomerase [Anaerolineae bacterium]
MVRVKICGLMNWEDAWGALEEGRVVVRVKICGLTNWEDAWGAVEAGADLLGFVLYPRSPRYVAPEVVAEVVAGLRARPAARGVRTVGVFVNTDPAEMADVLQRTGLDLAQLSGGEPPHSLERLHGRAFKALRPGHGPRRRPTPSGTSAWGRRRPRFAARYLPPAVVWRHGRSGDWQIAAALAPRCRLLLAGGLTPTNVAAAIQQVHPWGVDVSSGVEAAAGRKDHQKVWAFIQNARSVNDTSN